MKTRNEPILRAVLDSRSTRHLPLPVYAAAATLAVLLLMAGAAGAEPCGQPVSRTERPTASDALFTLRAAVGVESCRLCVCDVDASSRIAATDALAILGAAVSGTRLATCAACDECPDIAQFVLFAGTRGPCASTDDCEAFSVCDPSIGRCRTATRIDSGWTGLAHGGDANDTVPARLRLDCPDTAPCGTCDIVGLDPSLGNCRCANDNRQVCFSPTESDPACGGDTCECYFGPPLALSSGNTPTCVLNRLGSVPAGEADVDAGAGTIELDLEALVHTGVSGLMPCPVCSGDDRPGDGQRAGVCVGGANDGASCDAQSPNTTFPPPTGSFPSLDCFPSAGANVSGDGLALDLDLTTGSTTLDAGLDCGGDDSGASCACRVCSGDPTLACSSDAVCAARGAGTCTSDGGGEASRANACNDGVCTPLGDGSGFCEAGPVESYCDAIVRADGRGLVQCSDDDDCSEARLGIDGGACVLSELRSCFPESIVAGGAAHPIVPLAAAAFCVPPTVSASVNAVAGLPGPARLFYQSLVTSFCASDPSSVYQPGAGGCP